MAPNKAGKGKRADVLTTRPPAGDIVSSISWPILPTPAQRSHPLELEELVANQIVLLHGFFPAKICAAWVKYLSEAKNILLEATPPAKRGEAQRTNHRFSIHDEAFAKTLWEDTGLGEVITNDQSGIFQSSESRNGRPMGLNPNIRIYRYEPGQSFAPHYDDTVKIGANHTEWTLLIYLSGSENVDGGETAFYPCGIAPSENGRPRRTKVKPGEEDVVVELQQGLALLHRHGRDCLLHEGRPVIKGTKWVLRSDVIVGH